MILAVADEQLGDAGHNTFRIGIGYDIHRLAEGVPLRICGVTVASERGSVGHSDADVALHALCDALLGALALGDIGALFPDTDPRYKGIDSRRLLAEVAKRVRGEGYGVENVDVTVVLERPKLRAYVEAMRGEVAGVLSVDLEKVSVKAKTNEGLDAVGRGEAIACQAVALLRRQAICKKNARE